MFLTIRLFVKDIQSLLRNEPNLLIGHLGGKTSKASTTFRVIMQSIVSLAVLAFGFTIILSPDQTQAIKELAAGFIGTVIGYWLR